MTSRHPSSRLAALLALALALGARGGQAQDSAAVARAIDSILAASYPANGPGAAVLVTRGGRVLLRKGYGLANVERGTAVTPETVFRIASVTKVFAATAALLLADQGRIALDSPVTTYLPDYPAAGRGITVRHLLSHTAGLPEYLDRPDVFAFVGQERPVQDLVASFRDRPAVFAPGERDAYSNSGYILLGAILERVSGIGFGELVRTRIFAPLGMRSTACAAPLAGVAGLAEAYEPERTAGGPPDWNRLVVARPYTMSALHAAGGCVSTVDDLFRFEDALIGGRLLRAETLAHSLAPVRLAGGREGGTSNGGWQLDRVAGRRAAMKGGALPGVCTWLLAVPDDSLAVVLLTNRSAGQPRCGMLAVQAAGIAIAP
jgi:D-alanyl-D-alanine carboxypeptidase